LERVSRNLIESHPDMVRQFVGRNAGIYALYRGNKLYYVGLATALRGRLKAHIRNRHAQSWDSFSIYLTNRDQHLREIEALALRIAAPEGARQKGKFAKSRDMRRRIMRAIRDKHWSEVSALFGTSRRRADQESASSDASALSRLLPQGGRLRGSHRGRTFKARARSDGQIRYKGKYHSSLTSAAKAAIKRTVNGWWFWTVNRGGQWVRLTAIRSAGTPVYTR
jgi:hypothetical protein